MRRLGLAPKLTDFVKQVLAVNDWFSITTDRLNMYTGDADPVLSEMPQGQWVVYKNTTSGEIRIWVNDAGTLKKSAAFT